MSHVIFCHYCTGNFFKSLQNRAYTGLSSYEYVMEHSVQDPQVLAAIDLGSNSFHMVLARVINGQVQIIEKRGEKVQLAAGLDPINGIAPDAQERALACLERFAQSLRGLDRDHVTILGTNTLRAASNSYQFMRKANDTLGFPIEVIAGIEEARLVYLGVAHTLSDDDGKRLVIDIGGGSTEFIIGERFKPIALESLHMGCVSYTDRFFADGKLNEFNFRRASASARRELRSINVRYKNLGWQNVVGSSGTIRAAKRVLKNYELDDEGLNLKALLQLKKILIQNKEIESLELEGIKDLRLKVFPAGLAILIGIFEALEIEVMEYSDGALREGALHDLLGRAQHEDVREATVSAMQSRFLADANHAKKVKETALKLYMQICQQWKIADTVYQDYLRWSADLHEIGLAIAHSHHHKHGAYLVQHCDMSGFSKLAQESVAMILRGHKRKLPLQELEALPKRNRKILSRLMIILRLSVLLHNGRGISDVIDPTIEIEKSIITLSFPEGFLENHAMTEMDLEREKTFLSHAGFELEFS